MFQSKINLDQFLDLYTGEWKVVLPNFYIFPEVICKVFLRKDVGLNVGLY